MRLIFNSIIFSGFVLLSFCFIECVAISWFYGLSKWCSHMEEMTGRKVNIFLKIAWTVLTPALSMVVYTSP